MGWICPCFRNRSNPSHSHTITVLTILSGRYKKQLRLLTFSWFLVHFFGMFSTHQRRGTVRYEDVIPQPINQSRRP